MKIEFTHDFIKIYKKRFSSLPQFRNQFDKRAKLFEKNPTNPILKDHHLSGKMKGYRAFSVSGDIRVVYCIKGIVAYFIDIGTHNQVY